MKIEGLVRFLDPPPDLSEVTVRVKLLDASRIDASSETVAEETILGVPVGRAAAGEGVRFVLDAPDPHPNLSYVLSAHVDLSGNGEIEVGDHITMESVPVESRSAGGRREVSVREVLS